MLCRHPGGPSEGDRYDENHESGRERLHVAGTCAKPRMGGGALRTSVIRRAVAYAVPDRGRRSSLRP